MTPMIPYHPLAEAMPLIEGAEFDELVQSVKSLGKILEPITLYEGKILDGRNRYRACLDAGVEPATTLFQGPDPVAFVLAKNLHRRHLTETQRAMIVAKYVTLERGRPPKKENGQCCPFKPLTKTEAARLAAVSARTICDARLVHANGTTAEIARAKSGKASANATAKKIRARKRASKNAPRRIQIKVPAGYGTLEAAVNAAIELERSGLLAIKAAKQIDVSYNTYQVGRDILLLSEMLTDKADVECLKSVRKVFFNDLCQVDRCGKLIKPMVVRVWGYKGRRFKSDKTRSQAFLNSMSFVVAGCNSTSEIEIPHLDKTQRSQILSNVEEAIEALRKLHSRLKEGLVT